MDCVRITIEVPENAWPKALRLSALNMDHATLQVTLNGEPTEDYDVSKSTLSFPTYAGTWCFEYELK